MVLLLLALLGLPAAAAPRAPLAVPRSEILVERDAAAREAWAALDAEQRFEIIEWFRAEVSYLPTFQNRLLAYVLDTEPRDAGLWPALEAAPVYDPAVHAPAQLIPRKALAPDSKRLAKKREEFAFRVPERRLRSAWVYDYTTGELRHTDRVDDLTRVFENGLAGFPPELDRAEALVERLLDDGSRRDELTAFAHAYTDRAGNVYPGLTLYDAWASGANMEMPDVDVLGIVHELDDDWRTWTAPVPGSQHDALYDRVEEHFLAAHRHRGLRHALARTYLTGEPVLRDGYAPGLLRWHLLWEEASSTPSTLSESLPASENWSDFLEALSARVEAKAELRAKGEVRRDTLRADGRRVREKLLDVMVRAGHLEPPEPAPHDAPRVRH